MTRARNFYLFVALCICLTPPMTGSARGQFRTYVQPFGDPPAPGRTFEQAVNSLPRLLSIEMEDFDDIDLYPPGLTVPELSFYDGDASVSIETDAEDGLAYIFRSPVYFDYPGAVDYQALVMGRGTATLTISSEDHKVSGISFWIFDDGRIRDSAYLISATDCRGRTVEVVLQSNAERIDGYQMEGFFGVTSQRGLHSISITPINPATGEFQSDIFEIDSVSIIITERRGRNRGCGMNMPSRDEDEEKDDDEEGGDDYDDDDDDDEDEDENDRDDDEISDDDADASPEARCSRNRSSNRGNHRRFRRWHQRFRNRINARRDRCTDESRERRRRWRDRD